MKAADIAVSCGVGLCVTGLAVSSIQLLLAVYGRKTRKERELAAGKSVPLRRHRLIDKLSNIMLGPKRLDHEPLYSCMVSATLLIGVLWIINGPAPRYVLITSDTTRIVLAASLTGGAATCMYGICMGSWMDCWSRLRGREVRPIDVRRPYRVGVSGCPSIIVSLGSYGAIQLGQPESYAVGNVVFLGFICIGMTFQCLRLLMEIRRINKTLPLLIKQEVTRRIIAGELGPDEDVYTRPIPEEGRGSP